MPLAVVIGSFADSLLNFRGPLLHALVEHKCKVICCAPVPSQTVIDRLSDLGVDFHQIPMTRAGFNPWHDVLTFYALLKLFRELEPDLVISYTIKPVIYGSLAARLAGVQSIYSMITGVGSLFVSGGVRIRLLRFIAERLYRMSLKVNDKVFFQNPEDKALFERLGLLREGGKARIINGSGVDVKHFYPVSFPNGIRFLLIARLLKDKGVREYVEAARIVKRKYPQVMFDLVGWIDDHPAAISRKELDRWIDEDIVNYLGRLDDVRPVIAASTIYVLPSYREGTPRTVLEAMAMARPVITSDAPGCRETVVDGVNGYLVPIRNPVFLAQAMERFIEDPTLKESMGQAGRKIAEERYDVHKVNRVILNELGFTDETCI